MSAPASTATPTPVTAAGTTTSWVAMTTGFDIPEECKTTYRFNAQSLLAFDPHFKDIDPKVDCMPAPVMSWVEDANAPGKQNVLSIQPLDCMGGYTTASTSVNQQSSTLAVCCPK